MNYWIELDFGALILNNNSMNNNDVAGPSTQDLIVDELKDVLELFNARNMNKLDVRRTPEVYITPKSNPKEVQTWLKSKEFDIV